MLERFEEALLLRQHVYSRRLKLNGEEHAETIGAAICHVNLLNDLKRFEEAKALLRKTMPVARRVLGESHELTLRVRTNYAQTLYKVDGATLDDLREAVTTLEETDRIARRVLGGVHPYTKEIEAYLRYVREVLCACEAPPSSA